MTVTPLEQTIASQRRAAEPQSSIWVSANAGSGKTRVLIDRVVRLLMGGTPPGRILCLTFTKAAAAEMSERLFEKLSKWTVLPEEELAKDLNKITGSPIDIESLPSARRLFAKALETPGGLKIQTIHAFCEHILGRFPVEAGITPHFEVLDDQTAGDFLREAQAELLEEIAAADDEALDDAWRNIIPLADQFSFERLINEIRGARLKIRTFLQQTKSLDDAVVAIKHGLGAPVDQAEEDLVRLFESALDSAKLRRASDALGQGTKTDKANAETLREILAGEWDRSAIENYASLFLTQKNEPRKKLMGKAAAESDPISSEFLLSEQVRIIQWLEQLKALRIAEQTAALLRVADKILIAYEQQKTARGFLDYDDLIVRTVELLSERQATQWVLYKLDGGIDHILVDEAQDTNPLQWAVIRLLSEEFFAGLGGAENDRTLFAVGDEKQSIYSFQGADPTEFGAMRAHFGAQVVSAKKKWGEIALNLSFRSTPSILEVVDEVFAADEAAQTLTSDGGPISHESARAGHAGLVELWPTIEPEEREDEDPWDAPLDRINEQDPPSRLAERIASVIDDWLKRGESLASLNRAIEPGDIIILVRRRNAFVDETIRCLKQRGVPVAGTDRMMLTEQLAVMDLMALASFALLPTDDLTLAIVLKSPLVGLGEEDLFDLAYDRKGGLWDELKTRAEEKPVFSNAVSFLSRILARADFMPPYEFFAHLLAAEGGRKKLVGRLGRDANDPIDEFLRLALEYERLNAPSLQGFLEWIEFGQSEVKRDLAHRRNEVRVLTVHGAKGLESPVVFLPDTCATPAGRHAPALLELPEDGAGLRPIIWPGRKAFDSEAASNARAANRTAAMAEYNRLLYVAMTRASDRLYVCGYESSRGREDECWYDMVASAMEKVGKPVETSFGEQALRVEGTQTAAPAVQDADLSPTAEKVARPSWIDRPIGSPPIRSVSLGPSQLDKGEWADAPAPSPLDVAADARFARGRVVHKLLEILPNVSVDQRDAAARRIVGRIEAGLSDAEVETVIDETLAIFNHTEFGDLFGPNSRAEAPVAGEVQIGDQNILLRGQVDRLVIEGDHIRLIDYKTNRPPPKSVDQVSIAYAKQMAGYRAILQKAAPNHTVSCFLLWTVGPRIMELPAETLALAWAQLQSPGALSHLSEGAG
jgi:ATP-dependent helicase/nuclease subunit A